MAKPASLNLTADVNLKYAQQIFYDVKILRNRGNVDILLNFDKEVTENDYFRLEANSSITNWPITFYNLYYKTETGQANFYIIGSASNI